MKVEIIFFLITTILLLLGIVFTLCGFHISRLTKKKIRHCTAATQAVVIEVKMITSSANGDTVPMRSWYPVFEYQAQGHTVRKQSSFGQSQQSFHKGQKVELYYNPNNINEFYVPAETPKNLSLIFKVVGIALLAISISIFVSIGIF